jgi:CheY-like chemotaxis protein
MKQILFSGSDKTVFDNMESFFTERGIITQWVDTAEKTISAISTGENFDLVILHEEQPDMAAKELIERIIMKNAMINCVVLSALPEKVFHDTYEGFGVLMQLSPTPDREDAGKIMDYLSRICAISNDTTQKPKGEKN